MQNVNITLWYCNLFIFLDKQMKFFKFIDHFNNYGYIVTIHDILHETNLENHVQILENTINAKC